MKYTPEITAKIIEDYQAGKSVKEIASDLSTAESERLGIATCIPDRSVIAKLSALGVYKRKEYLNKRGEPPTKKEEYITRIGKLLDIDLDLLESMEKVTKTALVLIERQILELKKVD